MKRTWEVNADECREMEEGSGWPFAERVACSVVKGKQGGDTTIAHTRDGKVSAEAFAKRWETYTARVIRYLDRWDEEADKGHVDPSSSLTPDDVGTLDTSSLPKWKGGKDTTPSADPIEVAKRWVKRLQPQEQVALVQELSDTLPPVEAPEVRSTYVEREPKTANVAALGALADALGDLKRANSAVEAGRLGDRQKASAEVMLRGAEAEIAVWRENVEGGISDEAIAALTGGEF